MVRPIVLIPARMNASRLPGKPLADIHGAPMIVHVWRRAMEADVGPVWVAADDPRVMEAVAAAGGKAIMTRTDHASGSDRIFEALGGVDADGVYDVVINIQGDLPTIEPSLVRACLAPLAERAVDISTLATPITRGQEKDDPNVVKVIATELDETRLRAALFHPRARPVGRGAPVASHRSLRLSPRSACADLSACRLRLSSGARNSNNCGRWRPACGSTWRSSTRAPLGVDAPDDLERARVMLAPRETTMKTTHSIAYQGEPGRQLAHRLRGELSGL